MGSLGRLTMFAPRHRAGGLCLLVAAACGDPQASLDSGPFIIDVDGGTGPAPTKPWVEATPSIQPYGVLTLRGMAEGRRIYIEGVDNRRSSGIEPGGSFCADIPLPSPSTYEVRLRSQGDDGQLSEWAGPFVVTYDPSASPIAGATTCTGADPAGCTEAFEICGNQRDDDCNGLVDDEDPRCRPCVNDDLEPNDAVGSPRVPVDQAYDDLVLCAGDDDWFGVMMEADQTLSALIRFSHAEGDINLELIGPNRRDMVEDSRGLSDVEQITYTATTTGVHHLHVFGDRQASNTYRLELQLSGP